MRGPEPSPEGSQPHPDDGCTQEGLPVGGAGQGGVCCIFGAVKKRKGRVAWLSSPLLMKLPVPHALPFIRGVPGQEGGGQAWGREPRAPE